MITDRHPSSLLAIILIVFSFDVALVWALYIARCGFLFFYRAAVRACRLGLLIDLLAQLERNLTQRLHRLAQLHGGRLTLQSRLEVIDRSLDLALRLSVDLITELTERLLAGVDQLIGLIARLDLFQLPLVLFGMGLGLLLHSLTIGFAQPGRFSDGDAGGLAGRSVFGRDVQDAVGVDGKRDVDLRDPPRRRGDAGQLEAP